MSDPQNMPQNSKYHWWYDANKAGVRNSPPSNMGGTPTSPDGTTGGRRFSLTSMLIGSPESVPGAPNYNPGRRDSLTKMYHLNDFGTAD